MSELDEVWAFALSEAEKRARNGGRTDVADYLALRTSNDLARSTGIDWLTKTVIELAGVANRSGASIQVTNEDDHRFPVGAATMVGRSLRLVSGVRVLTVEAGWPRTPRDGFIRGGALACGNLKHLGIKSASEELRLRRLQNGVPCWFALLIDGSEVRTDETRLKNHLTILLDL